MSGGGGGGDSKKKTGGGKKDATPAAALPAYGNAPTQQTLQPMMPGFQGMLANQLAGGFGSGGGGAPDFAAMLQSMYSPMSMMNFKEPMSSTISGYDKAKFAPLNTGNAALDKLLMGGGSTSTDDKSKPVKIASIKVV